MNGQARLTEFGTRTDVDLSRLTEAQRRAYVAVRLNGVGVREHARKTEREPGTVGNLLRRAEKRLDGEGSA
ncbi:sigma factor-like helix-turn-helix DNA-binding protein [Halostella salina]|uniref:sigma-70 region 4 domain-containing protein n=1 Tax=Halostella salina TaxID=1547897 RepID=UPI000EF7BF92|nr:sigma-70 region 4 domain-containing protein [Halostella salina]